MLHNGHGFSLFLVQAKFNAASVNPFQSFAMQLCYSSTLCAMPKSLTCARFSHAVAIWIRYKNLIHYVQTNACQMYVKLRTLHVLPVIIIKGIIIMRCLTYTNLQCSKFANIYNLQDCIFN